MIETHTWFLGDAHVVWDIFWLIVCPVGRLYIPPTQQEETFGISVILLQLLVEQQVIFARSDVLGVHEIEQSWWYEIWPFNKYEVVLFKNIYSN